MPTVTKRDLAKLLAAKLSLKKGLAYQCADACFDGLAEAIIQGNRIEVRGFGVWEVKETRAKNAHNPRTGEHVLVPARRKVMFKAGKLLRQALAHG